MKATDIKIFGIIGSGQMGSGIAQVAAASGYKVILLDVSRERAQKARDQIGAMLTKQVDKGKLDGTARVATLDRIHPAGDVKDLADADVVVEAATEHFDTKIELLRAADRATRDDVILASNTSSISITKLAAATQRPEQFIGLHFMNPVPLMKLVEIVRGVQTSEATYDAARDIALKLGKTYITSKDQPGFMVNRMLVPFLNEACFALQEGLGTMEDIDQGAKLGLNHPMGPFELADLIGLDTLLSIAEVLHREFGDDKYRPATLLRNLVAAGWFGKKSGRGFYAYDGKGQRTGRAFQPLAIHPRIPMDYEHILLERDGHVLTVTINRPDKLNALNAHLISELTHVVHHHRFAQGDEVPRVMILTGAGKAFVAGADIAAMAGLSATEAHGFAAAGHRLGYQIEQAPFPVLAAVNGFALGGGCELVLACDLAYASDAAKLGQPEVNLGVIPGFGGTQRLTRRVGIGKARELVFTGDIIGAEEAKRIGLVEDVFPAAELLAKVKEIAQKIAAKGPLAIAAAKRVIARGADVELAVANELEAQAFGLLFGSADQREGMAAFLGKRKATFTGK